MDLSPWLLEQLKGLVNQNPYCLYPVISTGSLGMTAQCIHPRFMLT